MRYSKPSAACQHTRSSKAGLSGFTLSVHWNKLGAAAASRSAREDRRVGRRFFQQASMSISLAVPSVCRPASAATIAHSLALGDNAASLR